MLETQQTTVQKDLAETKISVQGLRDEVHRLATEAVKINTSVGVIKWLIALGLPLIPALGAWFHKLIGV